jgi:nucleoside 2-deoxyribosyltransferase
MPPLKVYIAAPFSWKNTTALEVNDRINEAGHIVTSSWLAETLNPNATLEDAGESYWRQVSQQDLDDIDAADVFVLMTIPPDQAKPRGGRHVEFGYAMAKKKFLLILGPRENIFHYLPRVCVCEDIRDVVTNLNAIATAQNLLGMYCEKD